MHRVQDVPHQPQDEILARSRGEGPQEKARSFTRVGRTFAPKRPISVEDETIERATSVGKRIEEQEPGSVLRWPEPEQAIEHQQGDDGIHTANEPETHELPDGPTSGFSFGGGMHMCLVRFARLWRGRFEFSCWHNAQGLSFSHWLKACSAFHESLSSAPSTRAPIAFAGKPVANPPGERPPSYCFAS